MFEDPDDADAWAVYADALANEGDPLGELITLELRIEAAAASGRPIPPTLSRRYAALAEGGCSRWADDALAELLASPDATRSLALEWRRGHPYLAGVAASSTRVANELLATLLATRGLVFLTRLSVNFTAQRDETEALEFAGGPTLSSLQVLDIDGWSFSRGADPLANLDFDWDRAWPRLHTLRLRCPQLAWPPLAHQRLRSLTISLRHGFEPRPIELLASARLPALDTLQLFLGRLGADHSPDDARVLMLRVIDNPLLGGPGGLRSLGLCATQLPPSLFAALADAKLIRELRRLSLAWSTIGDEHMPALRAVIANATALEHLDLRRNYLSEQAVVELRALLGTRLIASDQKLDGERQLPVFGRYGFDDGSIPA